jgi:hypothetical protein
MTRSSDDEVRMTLSVQVTRYESPFLFEALRVAPKGKMRANRLRALADKGLLAESAGLQGGLVNGSQVASRARMPPANGSGNEQMGGDRSAAAVGAAQLFFGDDAS